MKVSDTDPPSGGRDPPADRSKAVLICPTCGYEAPLDGAWSVDDIADDAGSSGDPTGDDDRTVVRCPECGRVVVSQPAFGLAA